LCAKVNILFEIHKFSEDDFDFYTIKKETAFARIPLFWAQIYSTNIKTDKKEENWFSFFLICLPLSYSQ